jgi:hypothetical protein
LQENTSKRKAKRQWKTLARKKEKAAKLAFAFQEHSLAERDLEMQKILQDRNIGERPGHERAAFGETHSQGTANGVTQAQENSSKVCQQKKTKMQKGSNTKKSFKKMTGRNSKRKTLRLAR